MEEEKDDLLGYLSEVSSQSFDSAQQQSLRSAAREIEKLYRQKLEQERERYDRVSALAGVGAAAELLTDALMHEVNKTVMLLRILQGEAQVDASPRVQQAIERLARQMDLIHEQLDLMEPLYHPRSQFNDPVDIRGAVYDVVTAMSHRLKEAKVQVSLRCDTNLMVRISKGYLMQAILIVIANALEAMSEAALSDPRLDIQIVSTKEFTGILIANNGPAIPDQFRKLIFEPSFSMRKAGRGLGLHVARDLLAICHCALELAEDGSSSLPGPCFRIRFDRRKVVDS